MSLNFTLLRAARAITKRNNINNDVQINYRWLIRQYGDHVRVKNNGIVHYERLFQAMQIVPADFLHTKCHTPATELNCDWLHQPYKIQTHPFQHFYSFCDSRRSITFTSWTIEHYVKNNALFTEQEMYEWMMDYLLAIKY